MYEFESEKFESRANAIANRQKYYIDYGQDTFQMWNESAGDSVVMTNAEAQHQKEERNTLIDVQTYSSIEEAVEVANQELWNYGLIDSYDIRNANTQKSVFTCKYNGK